MSCFEHISLATGDMAVAMSLSVVSSVHCCMVISGTDPPLSTFISHRPALRTGSSPATGQADQRPNKTQEAVVACVRSPEFFHDIVRASEHTLRVAKTCPAGKP